MGAKTVAVMLVLDEQPSPEAESQSEARWRQTEHIGRIGGSRVIALASDIDGRSDAQQGGGVSPLAQ
jgi:hypothetical protein